ncbi:MAG: hypothetical protein AABZ60_18065, partial [Planctomycetota bacterium]
MDYQFEWIIDSKLALSQRPGYPWNEVSRYQIEKFVSFVKKKNIQAIVCFLTPEELKTEFLTNPLEIYREFGLTVYHEPIPQEEDPEKILQGFSLLEKIWASNQIVLFHGQSKENRILQIREQIQEKIKSIPFEETRLPELASSEAPLEISPLTQDTLTVEISKNFDTYLQILDELKTSIESYRLQNRLDEISFSHLEQILLTRKSTLLIEQKEWQISLQALEKKALEAPKIIQEEPLVKAKKKQTAVIEKKKLLLQTLVQPSADQIVSEKTKVPDPILPVPSIVHEAPLPKPLPPVQKKEKRASLFKFKEVLTEAPTYFIKPQKRQQLATLLPILYEKALWFLGSLFILIGAIYWVSNAWTSMKDTQKLFILLLSVLGLQCTNFFVGVFLERSLGLKSGGQNLKFSALVLTPLLFVLWGELWTKSLNWQIIWGFSAFISFYFAHSTLKDFEAIFRRDFLFFFILYNLWQVPVSFAQGGIREVLLLLPLLTLFPLCQRYSIRVLPKLTQSVSAHTNLFYGLLSYLYLFTLAHLYFRISQSGTLSSHGYSLMIALLGSGLLIYANVSEESRKRFTLFSGIGLILTISSIFLAVVPPPVGKLAIPGPLLLTLILLTVVYWKASFLFVRTYLFRISLFFSLGVYFLLPSYLKQEFKELGTTISWIKNTFGYQQEQRLPLSYYPITFLPFLVGLAWYSWRNRFYWKPSFYRAVHQLFAGISLVFTLFLVQGSWTDSRPALIACPLYVALLYGFFRLFHNAWYEMGAFAYLFLWTWYLSYPAPLILRATWLLVPFVCLVALTQKTTFGKMRERREQQVFFYYHLLFLMLTWFQTYSPLFPLSFYLLGGLGIYLSFRFVSYFSGQWLALNSVAHFAIVSLFLGAYLTYLFLGEGTLTLWHKLLGGYSLAQGMWSGIASIFYALFLAKIASLASPPLRPRILQIYAGFAVAAGYLFVTYHAIHQFFWPFQIIFLGQSLGWIGALKLFSSTSVPEESVLATKREKRFFRKDLALSLSHLAILPLLTSIFFCTGWIQHIPTVTYEKESILNFVQILLLFGVGYYWKKLELLQLSTILFPIGCWLINRSFPAFWIPLDLLVVSLSLLYTGISLLPQVKRHLLLNKSGFGPLAIFLYALGLFMIFSPYGSINIKKLEILNFFLFTGTSFLLFAHHQHNVFGILSFMASLVWMSLMKAYWHPHQEFWALYFWGLAGIWFAVLLLLERFSFAVAQKKILSWFPLLPALQATLLLYNNNISPFSYRVNDIGLFPSAFMALFGIHLIWIYSLWRKFYWTQFLLLPSIVVFVMLLYASGITPIIVVSEVFVQCSLIPLELLLFVFLLARHPNIPEKAYAGLSRSSQIFAGMLLLSLTLVRIDPLLQYSWFDAYSLLDISRHPGFAKYLEIYRSASLLAIFFAGYWFWKKKSWMLCSAVLATALFATGSLDQAHSPPAAYSLYFAFSGAVLLFFQKSCPELRSMGWLSASILPCFFLYEVRYFYESDWLLRLGAMTAFALCFAVEAGIHRQVAYLCGTLVCVGIAVGFYITHGFLRQDVFNCIAVTSLFYMGLTLYSTKRALSFQWKHLSISRELTQQAFQIVSISLIIVSFFYEFGLFSLRQIPQGSLDFPLPAKLWLFGLSHVALIAGLFRHAWVP